MRSHDSHISTPHDSRADSPLKFALSQASTVVGAYLGELIGRRPKAVSLDDIPTSPSQLTCQWLTAALCRSVPGAVVEAFEASDMTSGTSTRWKLVVHYNDIGQSAGIPNDLFVKTSRTLQQRMLMGLSGILTGEPLFYSRFRPRLNIEAPQGYYGDFNEKTAQSITIMEDIAITKNAIFLEPPDRMSRSEIESLLDSLATMHGQFWASPELSAPGIRNSFEVMAAANRLINMRPRAIVGEGRAAALLPAELIGHTGEVFDCMLGSLQLDGALPQTLLHGDGHVGQVYRTTDGRAGFADWQVVHRGRWAYDVAYTINSSLDIEDRRAWDAELIRYYIERLTAAGGGPLTFDDAWLEYRRHAFYPYAAWAFTLGRAAYHPRFQPDDYALAIIERTSNAIVDLNSMATMEPAR